MLYVNTRDIQKEKNIQRFVNALNNKELEILDNFLNDVNYKNIINDLYLRKYLTPENLEYLFQTKHSNLIIPTILMRNLLWNEEQKLLKVIYEYSQFYDEEIILEFCYLYKYRKPLSTEALQNKISDEKYNIGIDRKGEFTKNNFKKGNEPLIEYLVRNGLNVNQKCHYNVSSKNTFSTFLVYACENENLDLVKLLVEHGANVNLVDENGYSPLISACAYNNSNIAKYLIEHGADINQSFFLNTPLNIVYQNGTPLTIACRNGNEDIALCLLEHGANVNDKDRSGCTPISYACKKGNVNIIRFLMNYGADESQCQFPFIPSLIIAYEENDEYMIEYYNEQIIKYNNNVQLCDACAYGNEIIVKYLVEHGVKVNEEKYNVRTSSEAANKYNTTPLINACENNHEAIIKYLVEHGADANKSCSYDGKTPLLMAYKNKNETIIKYLIDHGANVNKVDYSGDFSLIKACENENEEMIKYLVEHGANVNYTNREGVSPLFKACSKGNETIVKYLIEHGANVNLESIYCDTPLIKACYNGNEAVIKYLVEHGANINHTNSNGCTPLIILCENGNEAIVKYLVEHGANLNQKTVYRETPLIKACQNGDEGMIKYLVERGASINRSDKYGNTPIKYASENGLKDIIAYLSKQGAHKSKFRSKIKKYLKKF